MNDVQARVLKERALALSRRSGGHKRRKNPLPCVVFRIGKATYAVDSAFSNGVCLSPALTPLPCAPNHIAGVFNFGGRILPVVQGDTVFGFGKPEYPDKLSLLILKFDQLEFGLAVDAVLDVRVFDLADMRLDLRTPVKEDLIIGIMPDGVMILDTANLFKFAQNT